MTFNEAMDAADFYLLVEAQGKKGKFFNLKKMILALAMITAPMATFQACNLPPTGTSIVRSVDQVEDATLRNCLQKYFTSSEQAQITKSLVQLNARGGVMGSTFEYTDRSGKIVYYRIVFMDNTITQQRNRLKKMYGIDFTQEAYKEIVGVHELCHVLDGIQSGGDPARLGHNENWLKLFTGKYYDIIANNYDSGGVKVTANSPNASREYNIKYILSNTCESDRAYYTAHPE